ncbi:MmcQ/YjbR family DNA-binding protein [Rubritalea tangerina]|uniref:MmcQ/YjbR family DNA-binding protein n=1 Tax=Rubritalea tangerina TaxID=430798 RepID=A0ABW4ZBS5_9BACT
MSESVDLAEMIEYCMGLPEVEEVTPFGPDALVYKVAGKMFAVTDPGRHPVSMNLKCDPDWALELRDAHDAVEPGWHMNKRHWNTVVLDGSLEVALLQRMIEHSYELVVQGLKKADRERVLAKWRK